METALQNAGRLLGEGINSGAFLFVTQHAVAFCEKAIKLHNFLDETRRALIESEASHKFSSDAVYCAVEWAIDYTNAVEEFVSWAHFAERIERVKSGLRAGDFRALESLLGTLREHDQQTKKCFDSFEGNVARALEQTYEKARAVQNEVANANSRKRIVRGVGGTASSLLLAGSIAGVALTVLFPPAGMSLLVGAVVGSGAAGTAGVATAVGTGIAAANIAEPTSRLTELGQMLDDLSTTASCWLSSVKKVETWLNRCVRAMSVTGSALEYARTGYIDDVLEAVESLQKESSTLHVSVCTARAELKRIRDDLEQSRASASIQQQTV
ncbi:uncharacterized protein LOC134186745 [Corticium candelabrum]|uniref:uncharacterized protein LOC134186745 n=1 Tax=Corticium candelabrum TaxID=121492 RepID=UPI002E275CBD|nr:uncharacterized protein LOC134186745 [Corticium candelabrum]